MNPFVKSICAPAVFTVLSALLMPSASVAQVAGQNVNMVSGTQWPTGDPFLQRQNEPSMAVSTRNPMHILAGSNDYRSVDLELVLSGGAETGDSWLGLFKSFDGGLTWQSTLLPGCPQGVAQCTDSGALGGRYQAASDPVVRAGTNGMFYYAGLAFDRPTSSTSASSFSSIFVARYNDLNNNENVDPITYIDTHIVATGNSSQFLDKPAMAVDLPRSGAMTCSFSANEPGTGPNGGALTVHQSFPAGNVYLTYTDFLTATKGNTTPTHLMFTRSTDCGVTWSTPIQINSGTTTSQGSAIAVNPVNGNVYVAWRQFASTGVSDAIMIAQSSNGGSTFGSPLRISTFQPFDQGTTGTSFRTNAFPAITTDFFGFVYVAFSARGLTASGDARVVVAGSIDGTHWTPAIMVDNPSQNALSNPSGRGHQIMPAMTFANGRLTILYYDLRLDHYSAFYTADSISPTGYTQTLLPEGELAPPSPVPSKVFSKFIDDNGLTLRRHTLDLRVLELGLFPTVTLGPSVLVSQYDYGCCVNPNAPDIEQFKFNVPNLPLFSTGEVPFFGDYIEVVPSPLFVPNGNSWSYNLTPSVNPLFHASWTDNRDVVPPADGNWQNYTPAVPIGTTSIFQPGSSVASCRPGQEGMRNQNIYTAQITGGLVVGAPGNAKQLGTTVFNNTTVPFQRAFAVEAQNVTGKPLNVRFTIANQPTGGSASFLQFSPLTRLDVTIPAFSSVSRSVFVTSSNPQATVTVNVAQINAIGGFVVTNGLSSSALLNPDITNPSITNPSITNPSITNPSITNFEVTNPSITNPSITNPSITNPSITNPSITNPSITNPSITNVSATNPSITNPSITNPDITNPSITNPSITNPSITNGSIQDVLYPITNNGNTTSTYTVKLATLNPPPGGIVLQLILNRLYQTPVANNCQLGNETHWVTVSNITNPKLFTATDPQLGNPDITNPIPNEASITLGPGETGYITLRVVNPTPAQTPFNPLTSVTPVTIPQAVNTETVLANPGNPNLTAPPVFPQLTILSPSSLPATDQGNPGYSFQLQSTGGKPGTGTWSIIEGALPSGMSLSPSGLVSGQTTALGPNSVTVQVADSAASPNTASKTISIPVNLAFQTNVPGIINDGVVGQSYVAFPFTTTGGTLPITWAATNLPPGLSINPSTGQISGSPSVVNPAGSTVQVTARDSALPPSVLTRQITIRVGAVIVIAPPTLPSGTIGVSYSTQLSATGGIGSYVFGPPAVAGGGTVDSSGLITFLNPQLPSVTFAVTVHDQANPNQFATANYTILFAAPAGPNVTFLSQPPNYTGGQTSPNSPVHVHVADNSNAPVANAPVTISLNGTPPCSTAVLSGTLTQSTGPTGDAFFFDLSVDRGQLGYALRATVAGLFAVSNPFNVNGFCSSASLSVGRELHTAILLSNGKVLIAGGLDLNGVPLKTAEVYDPSTGTVSPTGNLSAPNGRGGQASIALQNGQVLLIGGRDNAGTSLATAELYDPVSGTFSPTSSMAQARGNVRAVLLANGKVLIAGGSDANGALAGAEIYDPVGAVFTPTGSLSQARERHTMTLLPNGKVLVTGGRIFTNSAFSVLSSAELFDPQANQGVGAFTTVGNMNSPRDFPTANLLSNGTVLLVGGFISYQTNLSASSAEIFDPATNAFTLTGSMSTPRTHHTASLLPDGTVLVAGGVPNTSNGTPAKTTAEIYGPATGTFSPTGSMTTQREYAQDTALVTGNPLIVGGDDGINVTSTTEIYYSTPLPPTINGFGVNASNQPAIFWVASPSSGVVSYKVYRATTSGGPYAVVGSGVTSTTFTDTTAQSGQTYYYVVTAVASSNAESAFSNEVSVVVPSP